MLYLKQKKFTLNAGSKLVKKIGAYKLRIRFVVPAQEAKAVAPLSSILGQFGLNCPEFCKKFNEESISYAAGLLLTVYLDILFDRTFRFRIYGIDYSEFFITISNQYNLLTVLDLLRFNKIFMEWFGLNFWSSIETLLGMLQAGSVKLIFDEYIT